MDPNTGRYERESEINALMRREGISLEEAYERLIGTDDPVIVTGREEQVEALSKLIASRDGIDD